MPAGKQFPHNPRFEAGSQMAGTALESQLGPEGNFPVIVGAVNENDFVPHFKAQADRTQESFDSPARIEGRIHVVRSEIIHTAYKRGK
jgi:hypothetical protein